MVLESRFWMCGGSVDVWWFRFGCVVVFLLFNFSPSFFLWYQSIIIGSLYTVVTPRSSIRICVGSSRTGIYRYVLVLGFLLDRRSIKREPLIGSVLDPNSPDFC